MPYPSQMQVKLHLWLNLNERRLVISNKLDGRLSLLWCLQKLYLLTSQSAIHRNANIWESLAGWRRKAYSPLHKAPEARSSRLMNEMLRLFFKWDKQPSDSVLLPKIPVFRVLFCGGSTGTCGLFSMELEQCHAQVHARPHWCRHQLTGFANSGCGK